MTITDVWVRKVTKEGKLKAIVSITVDNEFVVHDIKVIEGTVVGYTLFKVSVTDPVLIT